jgi:hypothetical protein
MVNAAIPMHFKALKYRWLHRQAGAAFALKVPDILISICVSAIYFGLKM